MNDTKDIQSKTIQERMAEEELVQEKIDEKGRKWRKAYFGGGEHFKNWLAQCKELGEVMVEEIDSTGYKCFEEGGEKLYRIWLMVDEETNDDLVDRKIAVVGREQELKKEIQALEEKLKDREASLPAHSVRPQQMLAIEELETAIEEKKKELNMFKKDKTGP